MRFIDQSKLLTIESVWPDVFIEGGCDEYIYYNHLRSTISPYLNSINKGITYGDFLEYIKAKGYAGYRSGNARVLLGWKYNPKTFIRGSGRTKKVMPCESAESVAESIPVLRKSNSVSSIPVLDKSSEDGFILRKSDSVMSFDNAVKSNQGSPTSVPDELRPNDGIVESIEDAERYINDNDSTVNY